MTRPRANPTRVTIRQIAKAANVSPIAVSYAMRGSPKISEATRKRIQETAAALGYRPDPLLSHLMTHLRSQRRIQPLENVGLLQFNNDDYSRRLIRGARERAESLGYNLDVIAVDLATHEPRKLQRIIEARGIRGLLLTPAQRAGDYQKFLNWDGLSVVAIAKTVLQPHFHRVLPAHLTNIDLAVEEIRKLGYQRIGLAMHADMELRSTRTYSATLLWDAFSRGEQAIPPFKSNDKRLPGLDQWILEHRPDVILGTDSNLILAVIAPQIPAKLRKSIGLVSLDYMPALPVAGVDQRAEAVGAAGFEWLVGQLQRGERGIPRIATLTSVEGVWRAGPSVRPQRRKRAAVPTPL
jgi:DNA-binding LacI/PurR family transcriptional regulator